MFVFYQSVRLSRKQKIQTVSAVDADDPVGGHKFFFSLAMEGAYRGNFTVKDNGGEYCTVGYFGVSITPVIT